MEENKLNWEKLEPLMGGWAKYLKPLFEDERMYNLFVEMKEIAKKETLTPKNSDLFRFLEMCPPEKLKLIIIAMDSYPAKYKNGALQATGIPMDCGNSPDGKIQPSLGAFYDGLSNDIGIDIEHNKSLLPLCKQGILFGNRSLNCKLLKTGSMMGKWDIFWDFFFTRVITPYFIGVPIVFLGKDSLRLKKYVFELSNPVFELTHPSYAARTNSLWDTKGTFKKINNLIRANNGESEVIRWDGKISENNEIISQELPWNV